MNMQMTNSILFQLRLYFAYFFTIAVVVFLGGVKPENYADSLNTVALFGITYSVAIFSYASVIKDQNYQKKIIGNAEISFLSTILFLLGMFGLPAKEIADKLNGGWVALLFNIIHQLASIAVTFSIILFASALLTFLSMLAKEVIIKSVNIEKITSLGADLNRGNTPAWVKKR